jgi:hypothetical protein
MCQDHCANADLDTVLDFNALWVFVLQVDFITDEDVLSNLDASPPMQKRPEAASARELPCQKVKDPIEKASIKGRGH